MTKAASHSVSIVTTADSRLSNPELGFSDRRGGGAGDRHSQHTGGAVEDRDFIGWFVAMGDDGERLDLRYRHPCGYGERGGEK